MMLLGFSLTVCVAVSRPLKVPVEWWMSYWESGTSHLYLHALLYSLTVGQFPYVG